MMQWSWTGRVPGINGDVLSDVINPTIPNGLNSLRIATSLQDACTVWNNNMPSLEWGSTCAAKPKGLGFLIPGTDPSIASLFGGLAQDINQPFTTSLSTTGSAQTPWENVLSDLTGFALLYPLPGESYKGIPDANGNLIEATWSESLPAQTVPLVVQGDNSFSSYISSGEIEASVTATATANISVTVGVDLVDVNGLYAPQVFVLQNPAALTFNVSATGSASGEGSISVGDLASVTASSVSATVSITGSVALTATATTQMASCGRAIFPAQSARSFLRSKAP